MNHTRILALWTIIFLAYYTIEGLMSASPAAPIAAVVLISATLLSYKLTPPE